MSDMMKRQPETASEVRWNSMYRAGLISCFAMPVMIVIAIGAYLIWPYTPGISSMADIFNQLQLNRFGGLVALDFIMVLMMPVTILILLSLFAALKRINESIALIALVFGLVGNILIFTARPLLEMTYLSGRYAEAVTEAERSHFLAAGEALNSLFNGTSWLMWTVFTGISYFLSSLLMLRSRFFSNASAYTGIALTVIGIGVFIPVIGTILSLAATAGSIIWYVMLGKGFSRLLKPVSAGAEETYNPA